jgi:hypothetical protein
MRVHFLSAGAVLALFLGSAAMADTVIGDFVTPIGAVAPGAPALPVSAEALFTWDSTTGKLTITVTNKQTGITSVAQAISDLAFTVQPTETIVGYNKSSTASSTGIERNVAGDTTWSDPNGETAVATGWDLTTTVGSNFEVDRLGSGKIPPVTGTNANHLIIGPPSGDNKYDNANGSIAGNDQHNPFLHDSATFYLMFADKADVPDITSVTFSFNTTEGDDLTVPKVPEPSRVVAILGLGGMGLIGMFWMRRSRAA